MRKTHAWIEAARLRTLPLSLSGILVGLSLSSSLTLWTTIGCLFTTIFFQVLSNFANDLGDALKGTDNEDRLGPARTVQTGSISPSQMRNAVILMAILGFISAGVLIYTAPAIQTQSGVYTYILLAIACILAAITYTLGKKAYGYYGLGDVMVFLFFGGVAVIGTRHLFTPLFSIEEVLGAISVGGWSTMVLNLNNMRDIANDARSGKNTLVVKLGSKKALVYHSLLVWISCGAWMLLQLKQIIDQSTFVYIWNLLPLALFFMHLKRVQKMTNPKAFDPELKKVALSTFITAICAFVVSFF